MTLQEFISVLKTPEIKVILKDNDTDDEIIKFYSDGYSGVEADILAREVNRWEITSQSAITIVLNAATNSDNTPEPNEP